MSIKERPNKKKQERVETNEQTEDILDWLDAVDIDAKETSDKSSEITETPIEAEIIQTQHVPEKVTIQNKILEPLKPEIIEKTTLQIFVENLPKWISKPWMYIKPQVETQLNSWIDSWKIIVLDYSRIQKIHVINIGDLQLSHPFTNQSSGKNLSNNNLTFLIDQMKVQGFANWLDTNKILVRIKYKTDEEWAELIFDFLVETGYAAEILTFYELEQLDQEWTTIPRTELVNIFEILVKNGRAEWVGSEKDTLKFII